MEFQLINRTSKAIADETTRTKSIAFITIETRSVLYMSAGAAREFGIEEGMFIHFANDKGQWYFIVNNDNTGFKLTPTKQGSYRINNGALVRLFMKSTKQKPGNSFYLQKTEHTLKNCPVIFIMADKSIQQIKKNIHN